MIVVSDTTPLNYLILIEAIEVLPAISGRLLAPSAVIGELSHPRSPDPVRQWASYPPEWLTVQDPARIDASLKLGAGESAAISMALNRRPTSSSSTSARVTRSPYGLASMPSRRWESSRRRAIAARSTSMR